jgi:predicted DNA-binding protein (MmcQ/YjbR family)
MSRDDALTRLRSICLSFPEAEEYASYGHPTFRVGKKAFAAFEAIRKRPTIAFRIDPMAGPPAIGKAEVFDTPYGRGQWSSIWADGPINWRALRAALRQGYDLAR